ncbi:MAG: hypothetical protein CMA11_01995 [Euryarchaeota archaeon]|nr:hypothetical protein [Euryarchaeota archaeon]|tara:strand:- start:44 stop:535 length:492 start_codon:yes stop_codon:yes gene_type:complete
MGAGGEAPPVKSSDVMILVGASILLVVFILQAWAVPITITAGEEYVVKYDLAEGDTFSLVVEEGSVRPTVLLPSGDYYFADDSDDEWSYVAEESGVHSFKFLALCNEPSGCTTDNSPVIDYSVSRGLLLDFALYPIGALILGYGIVKRLAASKNEPLEAVLDD